MTASKDTLDLFLKDLAEAPDDNFNFNFNDTAPALLWTHPATQWALVFSNTSGTNTRFLEFVLKRPERVHTIVIHAGNEDYSLFQGAYLRTLLTFAAAQLYLDQDPRVQLYQFELRRGTDILEEVIAKAKESQVAHA